MMSDALDLSRHLEKFDPATWGDRRIDVIGCGTTGSRIAQEIGRLGVANLHLWDFDVVAAENIAPQPFYARSMIGRPKAEVCRDLLFEATGSEPTIHGRCTGPAESFDDELGEVVFLALDSMSARADVVTNRLRMNPRVELVIDPRMGVEEGRVYTFCPYRLDMVREWEATVTDDSETLENACQTRTTIGATASIIAGLAVQQFLQWYRYEIVNDRDYASPVFEIVMMTRPPLMITR